MLTSEELFFILFWQMLSNAQRLLWFCTQEILLLVFRALYGMLESKTESDIFKASTLPSLKLLQPQTVLFLITLKVWNNTGDEICRNFVRIAHYFPLVFYKRNGFWRKITEIKYHSVTLCIKFMSNYHIWDWAWTQGWCYLSYIFTELSPSHSIG